MKADELTVGEVPRNTRERHVVPLCPAMRFDFETKSATLVRHSDLRMNHRIAEHEAWDEAAIRERGEELAVLALKVWQPLPDVTSAETDDAMVAA